MLIWGIVLKSPGDKNKIRNDFMKSIYNDIKGYSSFYTVNPKGGGGVQNDPLVRRMSVISHTVML